MASASLTPDIIDGWILVLLGLECRNLWDVSKQIIQCMMTSSNGTIFRITGPLCGEFTGPGEFPAQRPVTRSFGVFFDLRLNKWLSKQPWSWWFETPPWSLWRQCNGISSNMQMVFGLFCFNGYIQGSFCVYAQSMYRWHYMWVIYSYSSGLLH